VGMKDPDLVTVPSAVPRVVSRVGDDVRHRSTGSRHDVHLGKHAVREVQGVAVLRQGVGSPRLGRVALGAENGNTHFEGHPHAGHERGIDDRFFLEDDVLLGDELGLVRSLPRRHSESHGNHTKSRNQGPREMPGSEGESLHILFDTSAEESLDVVLLAGRPVAWVPSGTAQAYSAPLLQLDAGLLLGSSPGMKLTAGAFGWFEFGSDLTIHRNLSALPADVAAAIPEELVRVKV
jgi:hypothetical protein